MSSKISALTALTGANVALTTDVFPLVDTSATTTKKITADELGIAINLYKTGTFTRVMTAASGTVAYTGVGFKPKAIHFLSFVANGAVRVSSKGYDDATTRFVIVDYTTTGDDASFGGTTSETIYFFDDTGDAARQTAVVTTFDTDGFTLTWTKTGSPTSTATIGYLALR